MRERRWGAFQHSAGIMGGISCEGKPAEAISPISFSCRSQEPYGTVTQTFNQWRTLVHAAQ
jgi:hypothetical protein